MDSPIAEVKISLNREKIGDLPTQKKSILKNAAKWSILLGAVTYAVMMQNVLECRSTLITPKLNSPS